MGEAATLGGLTLLLRWILKLVSSGMTPPGVGWETPLVIGAQEAVGALPAAAA
jgi:hypothetical protein